jgi:F-type H+-transporting ATPase subunit delta
MHVIRPVARRYGQAIFGLAQEDQSFDQWARDLERLADLLGVPLAEKALTSPAVPASRKLEIISQEIPDLQPRTHNLVGMLLHRDHLDLLPDIARAYRELLNRARGIVTAEVTTAVPLDEAARAELTARLGRYVGQQVQLQLAVDPSLIGGVVARIGDTLLDGSVRGRLDSLRRRLETAGPA